MRDCRGTARLWGARFGGAWCPGLSWGLRSLRGLRARALAPAGKGSGAWCLATESLPWVLVTSLTWVLMSLPWVLVTSLAWVLMSLTWVLMALPWVLMSLLWVLCCTQPRHRPGTAPAQPRRGGTHPLEEGLGSVLLMPVLEGFRS